MPSVKWFAECFFGHSAKSKEYQIKNTRQRALCRVFFLN
jgi:hypothetical protein